MRVAGFLDCVAREGLSEKTLRTRRPLFQEERAGARVLRRSKLGGAS